MKKTFIIFSLVLLSLTGCFSKQEVSNDPFLGLKKVNLNLDLTSINLKTNEEKKIIKRSTNKVSYLRSCAILDSETNTISNEKNYYWGAEWKSYYFELGYDVNAWFLIEIVDDYNFNITSLSFRDIQLFPNFVQYVGSIYDSNSKKYVKQYAIYRYNLWYIANQQLGENRPLTYTTSNGHSDSVGLYWPTY